MLLESISKEDHEVIIKAHRKATDSCLKREKELLRKNRFMVEEATRRIEEQERLIDTLNEMCTKVIKDNQRLNKIIRGY